MSKFAKPLLAVSASLLVLLAGCNGEQGATSSSTPSDASVSSSAPVGVSTLEPSFMKHDILPYGEESRLLQPEMQSASQNVSYWATIEDSDSAFLEFYAPLEECENIDELRQKGAASMEGIKGLLAKDEAMPEAEEYVDEDNGIQVYAVADTNLEMYSVAYQLDGRVVVSYVNTWDVYTNAGEPADFTEIGEKVQRYLGFNISAEDLVWAYNTILDNAIEGGSYQLHLMDKLAYRYVAFRIDDFGTESEVWTFSAISEYFDYNYDEEDEPPVDPEPETNPEPEPEEGDTTDDSITSGVIAIMPDDDPEGTSDVIIDEEE